MECLTSCLYENNSDPTLASWGEEGHLVSMVNFSVKNKKILILCVVHISPAPHCIATVSVSVEYSAHLFML